MKKQKLTLRQKTRQEFEKDLEKLGFVFAVDILYIVDIILVSLLKVTGKFREKDLEPFPKNKKKMIVVINHPDGNEWLFIYRRFFKPIYLFMPWLILRELPYTLADRVNFNNPFLQVIALALVFVDRREGQEASRQNSLRQCIRILKDEIPIIGFFEGRRTKNCSNLVYSGIKKKPLGKLNESLGFMVKQHRAPVKVAWIEFRGASLPSLPENGRFSLRRFLSWYWYTLIGRNGIIFLIWGKLKRFEKQNREEINQELEDYLLELADMV